MASILVIDDEEPVREMIRLFLARSGHEVATAEDGFEGLNWYRAQPTDVVLIDMMMPHNGLMAIRVLRDQFPEARVVAMSGASSTYLENARGVGACGTLPKPFTLLQLTSAIDQALQFIPVLERKSA